MFHLYHLPCVWNHCFTGYGALFSTCGIFHSNHSDKGIKLNVLDFKDFVNLEEQMCLFCISKKVILISAFLNYCLLVKKFQYDDCFCQQTNDAMVLRLYDKSRLFGLPRFD